MTKPYLEGQTFDTSNKSQMGANWRFTANKQTQSIFREELPQVIIVTAAFNSIGLNNHTRRQAWPF